MMKRIVLILIIFMFIMGISGVSFGFQFLGEGPDDSLLIEKPTMHHELMNL